MNLKFRDNFALSLICVALVGCGGRHAIDGAGSTLPNPTPALREVGNVQTDSRGKDENAPLASPNSSDSPNASTSSAIAYPPPAGPGDYDTKPGDTGAKIAASHNMMLKELVALNPGVSWARLKVGQRLRVKPATQ